MGVAPIANGQHNYSITFIVDKIVPDKLPPHIRAQIEEFKRKADHNSALSKEYNNYYDRFYTKDQPTYEQWLKMKGYQKMAKGGKAEYLKNSKVKHRVFHGTYDDFSVPKTNHGDDEYHKFGIHVGSAEQASKRITDLNNPGNHSRIRDRAPNVMPLHIHAKNPLRLDENRSGRWGVNDIMNALMEKADKGDLHTVPKNHVDDYFNDEFNIDKALGKKIKRLCANDYEWNAGEKTEALKKYLKKLGHDSIVYSNGYEGEGDSHILLDPHQIKSSTGNRGTYDPNEHDITKAKGGDVSLKEMRDFIKNKNGIYEGRRFERASDEVPHLLESYSPEALRSLFTGDNARALMTMNPAEFEKYSKEIPEVTARAKFSRGHHDQQFDGTMEDYLKHLAKIKHFDQIPYLGVNKGTAGENQLPWISEHEGRHRSRALANRGHKTSLVEFIPRAELREPFPRRHRDEYIDAIRKEMAISGNRVKPEEMYDENTKENVRRKIIQLPDLYADGGGVAYQMANQDRQFPEVRASYPHHAEMLQNALENTKDTNFSRPETTMGVKKFNILKDEDMEARNAMGYVKAQDPSQVYLNSNYVNRYFSPTTIAHEAQHTQDFTRQPEPIENYKKWINQYRQSQIENNFQKHIQDYPQYQNISGYGHQKDVPWHERIADMAAYESTLPKGQSLVDSDFGKKVFTTPEQRRYYQESVRPMEAKAFPIEDTLYDKAKEKVKDIKNKANQYADSAIGYLLKAEGGNVQGNQMDTPSLAQMRMKLNQRSNPDFVDNIGINEILDMSPKMYMNPDPKHNGFPAIGGVSDRNGLPVGGTDQNPNEPGQQIMPTPPAPPPQEGQQGQLGGGQPPQGMPPQGMAPQGAPPPSGNMLSLTPQGQTMGAMAPNPTGTGMAKGGKVNPKQMAAIRAKMMMHKNKKKKIVFFDKGGEVDDPKYVPTSNPKRILFSAKGHGDVQGIVVPRHMWEGSTGAGRKVEGMKDINKARAEVYGSEKRAPLTIGQVGKAHKEHLKEHFAKPMEQQIADEKEALARLRKAKHIGHGSNTLDESEKLDTVRHERDPQGRAYVGFASKGVAGHSLYTSGHGEHEEHHAINTCPGQTVGCGGGHDKNGIIDTSKGTCFAPNAESQYVNAAIRRASHEQAKHDPKMTRDWILAHTHSLRNAANTADKKNLVTLFRPNVVDETDVSSRHVIKGLNKQRKADDKPLIVANSYGKTNELHDPENGYHVTHSNVGPKTKHGASIAENISRDRQRVRSTIGATDASGRDFTNDEGDKTPPKNSYMVTDVKRNSPLSKEMERHIKHAKYWSAGRHPHELAPEEHEEGEEGHYNGKGESVPEHKSHYGHMTFEGKRYDYQRQHILHPRLVQVGKNEDGTPHMIPTDSRFKDEEFLPKNRYMTKNGKKAGAILMTTPTESTSNHLHHSSFTHHVNEGHVARAKKNNGEYEIDSPLHQVMSEGKEYVAPQPINIVRKAVGGSIRKEYDDDFNAFPERNFMAQHHLTKRLGVKEEHDLHPSLLHRAED